MEEVNKEILNAIKNIEEMIKDVKEKGYEKKKLKEIEIFVNEKYNELLNRTNEEIEINRLDHKIFEARLSELEAGQKYLKFKVEKLGLSNS